MSPRLTRKAEQHLERAERKRARWRVIGVSSLLVVLGLCAWLKWRTSPAPLAEAPAALSEESELQTLVQAANDTYRKEFQTNLAVADPRRVIGSVEPSKDALIAHYTSYYRYPHNSRPLNDDMESLLDPMKMQTVPGTVLGKDEKPALFAQFFAKTHAIVGEQVFQASLRVTDAKTGAPLSPSITKAVVRSDLKTGRVELGPAQVGPPSAPGGDYILSWQAPAKSRIYWGELELAVDFTAGGLDSSLTLPFSSTPAEPAKFTGKFKEELVDGSLVVHAEVEVTEPGNYAFEGNLYQAGSNVPISWSRNLVSLSTGLATVDYLFFGRIFHDKQAAGAFTLKQLRGYRQNLPYDPGAMIDAAAFAEHQRTLTPDARARMLEIVDEPLHQFVAMWQGEYTTHSYALEDFSDAEYDGADKSETLANLTRLTQETQRDH